ncbi:hypothetical protein EVAR_48693_1 [Eumeta japonica]|uniref:Uncharacterized protein n=1 Tax=Eumeta variegata TaxID=151549 RepID=A0A4C1XEY7_EUMVA|nr:hypothetical protein EVAR_48693_1 [Eumeta japonica]
MRRESVTSRTHRPAIRHQSVTWRRRERGRADDVTAVGRARSIGGPADGPLRRAAPVPDERAAARTRTGRATSMAKSSRVAG